MWSKLQKRPLHHLTRTMFSNSESESNAVKTDPLPGQKTAPAYQWLNKEIAIQGFPFVFVVYMHLSNEFVIGF